MIDLKINYKLAPLVEKHKPIKVAFGGRSSGKSVGYGDIFTGLKMHVEKADIYCLREFQDSISDSVHRVFKSSIEDRLKLQGWDVQNNTVIAPNGARTRYKGASRNPDSIQSAQGYKYSWFEEAQTASQESLDKLLPTILRNPGSECWFSANPQSSADPFSQRFIVPYQDQLQSQGYYEDDLHLIVIVNWRDNPWWNESQEALRSWDYDNLNRAKYDWIWEGAFNDSVEDALIMSEWFDACIDAHTRLGFYPVGLRMSSHDPSDEGSDSKGFAARHGSVVEMIAEKESGNVNDGGDWATGLAIQYRSDAYTWDCDGLGVGLNRQTSQAFDGKQVLVAMFKGSESCDNPDAIYNPVEGLQLQDQKKQKEVFKNKRAQYYSELRDRVLRTYNAVVKGIYSDPDKLISFDSTKISKPMMQKLRSELCRVPVKPNRNGLVELYTKPEMLSKFKIKSPNLADSVMMLMRQPHRVATQVRKPKPMKPMGRR